MSASNYQQFSAWLSQPFGQMILRQEKKALRFCWSFMRGELLLVFGVAPQAVLVKESKIQSYLMVIPSSERLDVVMNSVVADYEHVPILECQADAIVLPHTLEFSEDPYQVLREVENTLRPEGYLIVIGFNPWSIWGLRRLFSFRRYAPWRGVFRSSFRIKDWLRVLNFTIIDQKNTVYHLLMIFPAWLPKLKVLRKIYQLCCPCLGGVYIVVAKKKAFGVTPLRKSAWQALSVSMIPNSVAEPVRREF